MTTVENEVVVWGDIDGKEIKITQDMFWSVAALKFCSTGYVEGGEEEKILYCILLDGEDVEDDWIARYVYGNSPPQDVAFEEMLRAAWCIPADMRSRLHGYEQRYRRETHMRPPWLTKWNALAAEQRAKAEELTTEERARKAAAMVEKAEKDQERRDQWLLEEAELVRKRAAEAALAEGKRLAKVPMTAARDAWKRDADKAEKELRALEKTTTTQGSLDQEAEEERAKRLAQRREDEKTARLVAEIEGTMRNRDDLAGLDWDDLVGQDYLKRKARALVECVNDGKVEDAKKGMLFYGDPGLGKDVLVEIMAYQMTGATLFNLPPGFGTRNSQIGNLWELLIDIAYEHSPAIIYLGEADGLLKKKGSNVQAIKRAVTLGDREGKYVLILGSTNDKDSIDTAILSRFGDPLQFIPFTVEQRIHFTKRKILQSYQNADGSYKDADEVEQLVNAETEDWKKMVAKIPQEKDPRWIVCDFIPSVKSEYHLQCKEEERTTRIELADFIKDLVARPADAAPATSKLAKVDAKHVDINNSDYKSLVVERLEEVLEVPEVFEPDVELGTKAFLKALINPMVAYDYCLLNKLVPNPDRPDGRPDSEPDYDRVREKWSSPNVKMLSHLGWTSKNGLTMHDWVVRNWQTCLGEAFGHELCNGPKGPKPDGEHATFYKEGEPLVKLIPQATNRAGVPREKWYITNVRIKKTRYAEARLGDYCTVNNDDNTCTVDEAAYFKNKALRVARDVLKLETCPHCSKVVLSEKHAWNNYNRKTLYEIDGEFSFCHCAPRE